MNDELKHYGVLGMKWGIRRAQKKGTSYKYESMYTKNLKKAAAKAGKYDNKTRQNELRRQVNQSKILDRNKQKIASKSSTKGVVARRVAGTAAYAAATAAPVVALAAKMGIMATNPAMAAYGIGMTAMAGIFSGSIMSSQVSKAYQTHRALGSSKTSAALASIGGEYVSQLREASRIRSQTKNIKSL